MNGILAWGNSGLSPFLRATRLWARLLVSGLLAAWLLSHTLMAHAFGATECAASRFGSNLNCTANDVQITGMRVVGDTTSCTGGSNITLDLEVTVNFAVPDRWDVGIFISNDGKTPQLLPGSGGANSCSVGILPPSSPFLNLDPGPWGGITDICGDGNKDISGGTGSGITYMTNVTVPCQALSGSGGDLYIPFVVSWDNQKSPQGATCTSIADPVPNTSSKCNAPTIEQGTVSVVVLPTITKTDGITFISSGGTTTYTVVITNTTGAILDEPIFKDLAVAGIAVSGVTCAAAGGAICPATTVLLMQGAGIEIPDMPIGSSVTFTINATLTGSPGDTRTNTANVTVGGKTNSAGDTDTIVGEIAILPTSLSKSGSPGTLMVFNYTLYNFGGSIDAIGLSALSSQGWTVQIRNAADTATISSLTVATGGSANFIVKVQIPAGAAVGTFDTTTITAVSGNNPANTATATALTTVASSLTLTPNNTGAGGKGSSVFYTHRVQNNTASSQAVTFSTAFSGTCGGSWTKGVYKSDKVTQIPPATVTLSAFGGYEDIVVKVTIPSTTPPANGDICTVTTTATSAGGNTASATDATTVKNLVLYSDPGYTNENYIYPVDNHVYAKVYGLTAGATYKFRWYDSNNVLQRTSYSTSGVGTSAPDTYTIPTAGPLGTWRVEVWPDMGGGMSPFATTNFYVGPDHLNASYTGANPVVNTNATVNLSLHGKDHLVPKDPSGNLVKGNPPTTKDPLKITVTVSGSATIVSTTLSGAVITGQTVTGNLDGTTGTATITITDSVGETVTVTPASYNSALLGSPSRDEKATVIFTPASVLNHIRLEHDGEGVTCAAESITVKACADAACSTLYSSGLTTVTLSGSGWATNPITFTGSTTVNLSITSPQTVTLGTTSVSPTPTSGTDCFNGSVTNNTTACQLPFYDTGFIFSSIPNQVAGATSGNLTIQAVKKADNSTACVGVFTGNVGVEMASQCVNPTTCAGKQVTINSTPIANNPNSGISSYTSVTLNFGANSTATYTLNYPDVGQMRLAARRLLGGSDYMTGLSNAFVVRPGGFVISNIKQTAAPQLVNPAAANATDPKFVKAGENFTVTVSATTTPASGATTTPNYGKETTPEGVKLTSALVAPTGGALGSLGGVFGAFSNGVATADGVTFLPDGVTRSTPFTWNEVGIISLTPSVGDADYLGAGDTTGTTIGNVGRFIPDHFTLSAGALANRGGACAGSIFTYLDEGLNLTLTLTAERSGGGTTRNYDGTLAGGGYAKLTPGTFSNYGFGARSGTTNLTSRITGTVTGTPAWASGVLNALTANVTVVARTVTLRDGPWTGTQFGVAPSDSDGTQLLASALNLDVDNNAANDHQAVGAPTELRFGRLRLQNAYGSELLPLPVPVTVQYWNGTAFITNNLDSCTPLLQANIGFDNYTPNLSVGETTPAVGAAFNAGVGSLILSAPGPGNNGSVDLAINLGTTGSAAACTLTPAASAANLGYLRGQWCGGAYDKDPAARATFGVYKNPNEFIYLREMY